jgi:hypothetical protein
VEIEGKRAGIEFKPYYPLLSKIPELNKIKRLGQSSVNFETCLAFPSDASEEEARRVVEFLLRVLK